MKLSNFELLETENPKGVQAVLDFGKYHLSIIQSDLSYGGNQGKYEIGVFAASDGVASDMVELPGITNKGDTVRGWLSEIDVDIIIQKLYTITNRIPKQI